MVMGSVREGIWGVGVEGEEVGRREEEGEEEGEVLEGVGRVSESGTAEEMRTWWSTVVSG